MKKQREAGKYRLTPPLWWYSAHGCEHKPEEVLLKGQKVQAMKSAGGNHYHLVEDTDVVVDSLGKKASWGDKFSIFEGTDVDGNKPVLDRSSWVQFIEDERDREGMLIVFCVKETGAGNIIPLGIPGRAWMDYPGSAIHMQFVTPYQFRTKESDSPWAEYNLFMTTDETGNTILPAMDKIQTWVNRKIHPGWVLNNDGEHLVVDMISFESARDSKAHILPVEIRADIFERLDSPND